MERLLVISMILAACTNVTAQETLPPLQDGKVPQTYAELWAGYDPRKEPLDVEVLKEWEQDGVVLKVLRYRVGIFKGQKAMMAAVYGYPLLRPSSALQATEGKQGFGGQAKGARNLPGLVQIHGGGQYAHWNACFTNAKRGYATISIAWAGRLDAPGYRVTPTEVKLFWDGKTDDPNYKLTTDWGVLDGYHAPSRYGHGFSNVKPQEWTIDGVDSPRNDSWFLCTLGARRALTFLERQPEVDSDRLGVYGHSMGGQITVYTAGSDDRVKAAAPSCGGISYRSAETIIQDLGSGNKPYLEHIVCPIMFLSPANDFHGRLDHLPLAVSEIKTPNWRVTCGPHHNHQDTAPYEVATQLWMDQYLKGSFTWPATPETELKLGATPTITVRPDSSQPILALNIYYTQQGKLPDEPEDRENTMFRFWRCAKVTRQGDLWMAELPVYTTDRPLWVYANVHYPLDPPVTGAGYYYGTYTADRFNVSSLVRMVQPAELKAAGVNSTLKPTLLIADFQGNWEQEWFSYNRNPKVWERMTNKLHDPLYEPPAFAKLAFSVRSRQAGKLSVGFDAWTWQADMDGKEGWQDVTLFPLDLEGKDGGSRLDWEGLKTLRLAFDPKGDDEAIAPDFRNLRWEPGTREALNAQRTVQLANATPVDGKTYLDTQYADLFTHGWKAQMNVSCAGQSMAIGEKTYERGIGTHAHSETRFFLKGRYRSFHAEVGLQKDQPGSVRFYVYADDEKVFESDLMTRNQGPKTVDVDLTGVDELRLVVDDGGDGNGADHANWADAWVRETSSSHQDDQ